MEDGWLMDETINSYIWMLQQRDKELCRLDPNRKPTHFFNSFFFAKVCILKQIYIDILFLSLMVCVCFTYFFLLFFL